MKILTVLQKIKLQYDSGSIDFDMFIGMLSDACEKTVIKERVSLVRKFSNIFNIPVEMVENKILPKKKRHISEEHLKELSILYSKQPILYREIIKDDISYQCEMQQYGLIYGEDEDGNLVICGFMKDNKPKFFK